jgi:glycosyltransferase involved in cell wall biosynthesis
VLSAIIPMRNAAPFIEEALTSVLSQPEVVETIVVDDGSSDSSVERAAGFASVIIVRQEARGPGAARNAGARHANQPFLAFLDADDLWLPAKSSLQLAALLSAGRAHAVCAFEHFAHPAAKLPPEARRCALDRPYRAAIPSALMVARRVFHEIGGFDVNLATAEDVDWFQRADAAGSERLFLEPVLVRKRLHETNTSLVTPGNTERLLQVLRRRVRAPAHGR